MSEIVNCIYYNMLHVLMVCYDLPLWGRYLKVELNKKKVCFMEIVLELLTPTAIFSL